MAYVALLAFAVDTFTAHWFHERLNPSFAGALHVLSGPGSATWIGVVLCVAVAGLALKRHWGKLAFLVLTVPGGMLLGEMIKLLVHRHRPYVVGPFVDWAGYSFPSGHTIGATLLYGVVTVALLSIVRHRRWRMVIVLAAQVVVLLVALSRVALGAHYVTDVVAAMAIGSTWIGLWAFLFTRLRWKVSQID